MRRAGLGVLVVVLLLVGLAQTSAGTSVARSLGLAASSERFTELYFADQAAVAAATEGSDTDARTAHVSFVLINRESKPMTYHWQISSAGTERDSGTVALAAGAQQTVSPSTAIPTGCQFASTEIKQERVQKTVRVPGKNGQSATTRIETVTENRTVHVASHSTGAAKSEITVSLSTPRESIDYWTSCRA